LFLTHLSSFADLSSSNKLNKIEKCLSLTGVAQKLTRTSRTCLPVSTLDADNILISQSDVLPLLADGTGHARGWSLPCPLPDRRLERRAHLPRTPLAV